MTEGARARGWSLGEVQALRPDSSARSGWVLRPLGSFLRHRCAGTRRQSKGLGRERETFLCPCGSFHGCELPLLRKTVVFIRKDSEGSEWNADTDH